jgi:hypothetical protein
MSKGTSATSNPLPSSRRVVLVAHPEVMFAFRSLLLASLLQLGAWRRSFESVANDQWTEVLSRRRECPYEFREKLHSFRVGRLCREGPLKIGQVAVTTLRSLVVRRAMLFAPTVGYLRRDPVGGLFVRWVYIEARGGVVVLHGRKLFCFDRLFAESMERGLTHFFEVERGHDGCGVDVVMGTRMKSKDG